MRLGRVAGSRTSADARAYIGLFGDEFEEYPHP
jgi:hypothetical protein